MPDTKSATAAAGDNTKDRVSDYNPRWLGYCFLALSSLINLSSISNIKIMVDTRGNRNAALTFSVLTFLFSSVVLFLDRSQCFHEKFNFMKTLDGQVEGISLLLLTILWIVAVGLITQVDGIGYLTMNIYVSSWMTLLSCIYTLDKWSASKDILSIAELTGISATLKSWYVLFLASLVVFGTCINILAMFADQADRQRTSVVSNLSYTVFCCVMAFVSILLSGSFILVHYNIIEFCSQGGWIEMALSIVLMLLWITVVALVTQSGGVGATIVGSEFDLKLHAVEEQAIDTYLADEANYDDFDQWRNANCTVELTSFNSENEFQVIRLPCAQVMASAVPGSNLYVFTWLALLASVHICLRWKAQQAIQFAQAQNKKVMDRAQTDEAGHDDDDDDDDENNFKDASEQ